jgi:hypothetical protein
MRTARSVSLAGCAQKQLETPELLRRTTDLRKPCPHPLQPQRRTTPARSRPQEAFQLLSDEEKGELVAMEVEALEAEISSVRGVACLLICTRCMELSLPASFVPHWRWHGLAVQAQTQVRHADLCAIRKHASHATCRSMLQTRRTLTTSAH